MKSIILITFFSIFSLNIAAQGFNFPKVQNQSSQVTFNFDDRNGLLNKVQDVKQYRERYKDLYLFNGNEEMKIYSVDGKAFKVNDVNYNIKKNALEAKIDDKSLFTFNSSTIKGIEVANGKYVFYKESNIYKLYQLVNDSKIPLLKTFYVDRKDAVLNPMTKEVIKPSKFRIKFNYCTLLDNTIMELPSKKKKFYSVFSGKEKEIKFYIKDNKLDIKEESDLIKILNHYNSL